ncbi:MAG: long-chain fatty acid--CoA ligase [Burkholderiaceae bacterium]|jgi:long-chain acyl-CoA synthetase|nr:long-chain fatty acid--CoA ligase [Burkholderiaceae bacterium]
MAERLFAALHALPGDRVLLSGDGLSYTAATLLREVDRLASRLRRHGGRVLAVLADNGPHWVAADLAALKAGVTHLPLPGFFNNAQLQHALQSAAADLLLTDQTARIDALELGFREVGRWKGLALLSREVAPTGLPVGTAKLSFTSGSTGLPKGVCLSAAALFDTAEAVSEALAEVPVGRHLSVLPLALLLENVAGVYAPLLRGTEIVLPKLAELGWRGMGGFDPLQLARQVEATQPDSLILVPELLKAWTLALQAGQRRPPASLKYVAVGGARCDIALIERARDAGLPAYEGYGLTECGSVVSLNRPGADRLGSVGRPLGHVDIRVDAGGEIRIVNRGFLGYLHGAPNAESGAGSAFMSGDLGHRDAAGFLHLSGRRKNLIITAYGRNVAPEWVEAALLAQPEIAQAVVTGEARPWLAALLVPARGVEPAGLAAAMARANACLPDYARVGSWLACAPFSLDNGMATGNGRPVRAAILQKHAATIDSLYTHKESTHVVL